MNCDDVTELISAFADNELSQEKLSLLNSHTASCSDCSKYLDEVKELSGQIKQVASLSPPSSDFQARIIDSLNDQIKHMHRGQKSRRPASIIFAVAASFFVSIAGALIWADLNKPSL
ncbi:MAG: zf-HC2 domain-containing protein, partial [Leptolyngbya sp.]|nr:zf-HC2 domain-containing protein [Candidatus Melainabacteria bacterium]